MDVFITGSHGLIGSTLASALKARGDMVTKVGRDGERLRLDGLAEADAVVHLAGAGIGDERWTEDRKRVVLESRTGPTAQLAEALAGLDPGHRPSVLVSGSAIGYYGNRGDELLTEDSDSGDGFLAELCRQWEAAVAPAEQAGIRVVRLRSGLVLAGHGGLLKPLLLPFKLGLGGPIAGGQQWFSWIAIDDEVGAILHALDRSDIEGPMNATAPNPVRYGDFAKALGRALHRPAVLPTPMFAVASKLGREGAKEMVVAGQRVVPAKLQATDYDFRYSDIDSALVAAVGAS